MGWFKPKNVFTINKEWVLDPHCPMTRVTVTEETTGKTVSRVSAKPEQAEAECKRELNRSNSFSIVKLLWK